MACYTFTIGNREFRVSSSNLEGETPLQNFLRAINSAEESTKDALKKALLPNAEDVIRPDTRDNRDIPYLMSSNLATYGIEMKVCNEREWNTFCQEHGLDSDAKALLFEGDIYVRANGFSVNDAMHELTHLLLAVKRSNNFEGYKNFIDTLYISEGVQRVATQLKATKKYSDNYELDFKEEAVVMYLELIFSELVLMPRLFKSGEKVYEMASFLNENFRDPIKLTFAVLEFPGVSMFFKALLCDIPFYKSTLFTGNRMTNTTGYKDYYRNRVIEQQRIHAFIELYSSPEGGNLILKGDCL